MDTYAPFPRQAPNTISFTIDNQKMSLPPAPTRRNRGRHTMGEKCSYCTPGSTCPSCQNVREYSTFGIRPIARAQTKEATRLYGAMLAKATERPDFNF